MIMKTAEKKFRTGYLVFNSAKVSGATAGDVMHQVLSDRVISGSIFNNHVEDGTAIQVLHPSIGSGEGQRQGDEIWGTGIMLRGSITIPAAYRNATFKMWLVEYNSIQGNLWGTAQNQWPAGGTEPIAGQAGTIYQQFFYPSGASGVENPIMAMPRQDNIKPRLVGTYRVKSRDLLDTATYTIYFKKWIPFRRKLCFKDDTNFFCRGMKERFHLVVGANVDNTTASDTVIGNIQCQSTFYYKDP